MAIDGFTASVTKPSASIIIHIKADDNILENKYRTPVIFEWDDIKCKYIHFPTDYYMYTESVISLIKYRFILAVIFTAPCREKSTYFARHDLGQAGIKPTH